MLNSYQKYNNHIKRITTFSNQKLILISTAHPTKISKMTVRTAITNLEIIINSNRSKCSEGNAKNFRDN